MRVHKVEHCDCFPDGILVWLELTDLPERFQKQAREIDGGNFSPTAFGLCAFWDQANRTAELITDTDPETGNSRNAFYSDTNGEKHWFEISLAYEGSLVYDKVEQRVVRQFGSFPEGALPR